MHFELRSTFAMQRQVLPPTRRYRVNNLINLVFPRFSVRRPHNTSSITSSFSTQIIGKSVVYSLARVRYLAVLSLIVKGFVLPAKVSGHFYYYLPVPRFRAFATLKIFCKTLPAVWFAQLLAQGFFVRFCRFRI